MLGATTISTPMIVMITLGDWVTFILVGCLQISAIVASNTLGEAKLNRIWWCPIQWLPIGILRGATCGYEYTSNILLLN